MGSVVDQFGAIVGGQVGGHPRRARWLLATAYHLVGAQMRYAPPKRLGKAQSYIQSVVSPMMGHALAHGASCACVNVFLPCELLHAMDITPMFPEGLACYVTSTSTDTVFIQTAEEHGVPESYCSYHKMLLGIAESGVLPPPCAILNTSLACDANQLTFRRLSELYHVPHFTVDVPYQPNEDAVAYVADQLREMGRFLSQHTGKPLSEQRLRQALSYSRETVQNYWRYLGLRATRSMPDEMTSEMFAMIALHIMRGKPEMVKYTNLLLHQVAALPEGLCGKRLLWVHTLPYWQGSMKQILNFSDRCEIVASDMTYENMILPDPDHPYESMARMLVEGSYNGGADRRTERTLDMAKKMNIDGIVCFCHWGCKQTSGAAGYMKRTFEAAGYPTLLLDGDGCDSGNVGDGQMVTRLQAFMEQLEGRI
ncbi:MAG: 2-hydroxyacyl-CoA dehydratase family protein [Oscillospiraceae bacterium]|nr:2-hydroxyacyl-CoA dehydratase family protein [Oscillospiraceae bacterium]